MAQTIIQVTSEDIYYLSYHPDAFHLLAYLRLHHGETDENFTIPAAYCSRQLKWENLDLKRAIRTLQREGYIRQTYQGGKKTGDCNQYIWLKPEDANADSE